METRKLQNWKRYVLAIIIGTALFIIGFLITYSISYGEYLRVSNVQGELSYRIFQDKLKYSFFKEDICSIDYYSKITEDLAFQGQLINDLEIRLGKTDEAVLFRKQFYTLVEIEHFELIRDLNRKCDYNVTILLFFYSNDKADLDESERVGNILGVVSQRNPNVKIYSFDINLDSELINLLKEKYQVEKSPTIVVNEKVKITQVKNIDDIEKFFK